MRKTVTSIETYIDDETGYILFVVGDRIIPFRAVPQGDGKRIVEPLIGDTFGSIRVFYDADQAIAALEYADLHE